MQRLNILSESGKSCLKASHSGSEILAWILFCVHAYLKTSLYSCYATMLATSYALALTLISKINLNSCDATCSSISSGSNQIQAAHPLREHFVRREDVLRRSLHQRVSSFKSPPKQQYTSSIAVSAELLLGVEKLCKSKVNDFDGGTVLKY